jgi:hypothetical protein
MRAICPLFTVGTNREVHLTKEEVGHNAAVSSSSGVNCHLRRGITTHGDYTIVHTALAACNPSITSAHVGSMAGACGGCCEGMLALSHHAACCARDRSRPVDWRVLRSRVITARRRTGPARSAWLAPPGAARVQWISNTPSDLARTRAAPHALLLRGQSAQLPAAGGCVGGHGQSPGDDRAAA